MTPLAYLIDEYPDNKATDTQLKKFEQRMRPYSRRVLMQAIDSYSNTGRWFPKWAELYQHIQLAEQEEQTNYFVVPTDDELFASEVRAGTMRPIDTIEAEITQAAGELSRLLQESNGFDL